MKLRTFSLTFSLLLFWTLLPAQHVRNVASVTITVADLDRSIAFYTEVLDFEFIQKFEMDETVARQLFGMQSPAHGAKIASLRLGQETIKLMAFRQPISGRPVPVDSKSNDLWFQHMAIVVSDMDAAYRKVYDAGVQHVSTSPQTLPASIPAAAGITAFYFRDPDGHNLELIHYPAGKGNPKWQDYSASTLFLGIDHTAIGIDQTQASLDYYTRILDLQVGGNSENYGTEQEHLNQVFGARLLITGLHADAGVGIEFLDYIAPPGGRPFPEDSQVTDLWHWHTTLEVDDLEKLIPVLKAHGTKFVSQDIVAMDERKTILVRDPDGHALWLEERTAAPIK